MCSGELHRQGLKVRLLEARERGGVKMHGLTATGTRSPGAAALHQFSQPRRLAPFHTPLVKASTKLSYRPASRRSYSWPRSDQDVLRTNRSRHACMNCHFLRHHTGPSC